MFRRYSPSATEPWPRVPFSMALRSAASRPGLTRARTRYRITVLILPKNWRFLPDAEQQVAAVLEVMFIGREYFQRDGPVIAGSPEGQDAASQIYRSAAERHVKVGMASLVIVQMDVPQARAVGGE